jgi:hypothetical protein
MLLATFQTIKHDGFQIKNYGVQIHVLNEHLLDQTYIWDINLVRLNEYLD